mgnify:CR=1 FL=1
MAQFEGYERREAKILGVLKEYGISSIDECKEITLAKGIDVDQIVRSTQPICFENAIWAYTVGAAIAIKMGCTKAADAATVLFKNAEDLRYRYRSPELLHSRFCCREP